MRVDQALEEGATVLGIAKLELELRELGDSLDVCKPELGDVSRRRRMSS